MDDRDSGSRSPRPLSGFRLRWRVNSGAALNTPPEPLDRFTDVVSSPAFSDFQGHGFVDDCDNEIFDGLEPADAFMTGHDEPYEPESPVEDAVDSSARPSVLDPSGVEHSWHHYAFTAAHKRMKMERPKLPWEQQPFSQMFRTGDVWAGTAVSHLRDMFIPTSLGLDDVLQSERITERPGLTLAVADTPPVVKLHYKCVRRELPDEDIRRVALLKLNDIIMQDPLATQLGTSIHTMLGAGCSQSAVQQSISDCFRAKASSTLQKRASSLWRLAKFLRYAGVNSILRFTEEQLYFALCGLRESGAGATSAQHMLEALNFLDATAKFTVMDLRLTISGRCKGVARDMYLTKSPLEQKHPLTLELVQFLERLYPTLPNTMRCILGQLLFCIHACCRWKDSQRIRALWVETGHGESIVHADALTSKTTLSAESKTRFLPYLALGSGVNGEDWGSDWIEARLTEGLDFETFILPSFSERTQQWTGDPMSASEATYWLREYLSEFSLDSQLLRKFGSHSCKSTILTWAGRCLQVPFTPAERRMLGHHLDPHMKSILTYSRESFTTLYARVLMMFRCIRDGSFNPDLSAIDRLVQLSEGLPEEQTATGVDHAGTLQIDSDSDSSVASECGVAEDDFGRVGREACESLTSLFPDFPGVPESSLLVHKTSGLVHAMNEDGFLLCGRRPSANFKGYDQVTGDRSLCEGCRQCKNAFKH
eukprot:s290_g14.t1